MAFFQLRICCFIKTALRELERKTDDGSRPMNVKYIILVFFLKKGDSRMLKNTLKIKRMITWCSLDLFIIPLRIHLTFFNGFFGKVVGCSILQLCVVQYVYFKLTINKQVNKQWNVKYLLKQFLLRKADLLKTQNFSI